MGRKGIVTSIFSRLVDTTSSPASSPGGGGQVSPPWPWPSCGNNPRTSSFRAGHEEEPCCTSAATVTGSHAAATARIQLRGAAAGDMYKTVNSVYFDAAEDEFSSLDGGEEVFDKEVVGDDESCFSAMTTASEEWSEAVVRSLGRSTSTNRFFFDPGPPSNSILPAAASSASTATTTTTPPAEPAPDPEPDPEDGTKQPRASKPSSLAEGSVAVAVDSADPHADFRASMEEMVAAHGLRNWADLEELLSWYLRVNDKHNHPLIVGAFVDLLINLASSTTATTTTSASSSTGKSAESSTTTSTTGVTTTTTASNTAKTAATAARRRGSGASNDAPSSSSSSCATPDDYLVDVAEEKASSGPGSDDDDHVRRECKHHLC